MKWVDPKKRRAAWTASPVHGLIGPVFNRFARPVFLFVPAGRRSWKVAEAGTGHPLRPFPAWSWDITAGAVLLRCLPGQIQARRSGPAGARPLIVARSGTTAQRQGSPRNQPGLYALGRPDSRPTTKDDFENMARQFPAYDALYAFLSLDRN